MKKDPKFVQATSDVIENLEALQFDLNRCVDEGMLDYGSAYYNELSDLLEEAHIVKTPEELSQIIILAKTLETDINAWKSLRGQTTVSLTWPIL